MADIRPIAAPPGLHAAPVRKITVKDLDWALREGWNDFQDRRGDLLVVALIYPLVAFIAVGVSFNTRFLPLLFPLLAGLSILGPVVASGFYELARRRELGEDASWSHFFDPVQGRSRTALALLTAALGLIFILWMGAAALIFDQTLGRTDPTAQQFLRNLFTTPEGWTLVLLGNFVGFLFAAITLVISLVSAPMVVDRAGDAPSAVATSIAAVSANPGVVAAWGLRIAALLVLGALPAFVGLAVVLPVLGYASWHLYTRLVAR